MFATSTRVYRVHIPQESECVSVLAAPTCARLSSGRPVGIRERGEGRRARRRRQRDKKGYLPVCVCVHEREREREIDMGGE